MNKNILGIIAATVGVGLIKGATGRSGGRNEAERLMNQMINQAIADFGIQDAIQAEITANMGNALAAEGQNAIGLENDIRNQLVYNRIVTLLELDQNIFNNMTDADKLAHVVWASNMFKAAQRGGRKFPKLVEQGQNLDYLIEMINSESVEPKKLIAARSISKGMSKKIMAQISAPYSKFNQLQKHKFEEYSDQVTSGIKAATERVVGQDDNVVKPGLLEKMYLKKETKIFPSSFINYTRMAIGASYIPYTYDLRDNNQFMIAYDDSYVFNPLTSELGPGVLSWVSGCLEKMMILENMISSAGSGSYPERTVSALKNTSYLVKKVFSDPDMYQRVFTKFSALTEGNPIPLDLSVDVHMLVTGFIYRMAHMYSENNLPDFIVLADIGGQPLVPFGACTPDSYRETLQNFLSDKVSETYRLKKTGEIAARLTVSYQSPDAQGYYVDGMGYSVDNLVFRGWSALLVNAKDSQDVKQFLFQDSSYSALYTCPSLDGGLVIAQQQQQQNNNEGGSLVIQGGGHTLTLKDLWDWEWETGYVLNDLTVALLSQNNKDFRKKTHGGSSTMSWGYDMAKGQTEVRFQGLLNLKGRILGLGLWMFESTMQITRLLNSGNLTLAEYLLAPIFDIQYLDVRASRYNLPPSSYPSHVLSALDAQKEAAAARYYHSPDKGYGELVNRHLDDKNTGLRAIFNNLLDINKNGRSGGPPLDLSMGTPFNDFMYRLGECPYVDMDWGNPKKKLGGDRFITGVFNPGANAEGIVTGEYVFTHIPVGGKIPSKHIFKKSSHGYGNDMLSPYEIGLMVQGFKNQGYKIQLLKNNASKNVFERYHKGLQNGYVTGLSQIFRFWSQKYGVPTAEISKATVGKLFGLIFGGDDLNRLSGIDKDVFDEYIQSRLRANKEVPTQSLGFNSKSKPVVRGVDLVSYIKGLKASDNQQLIQNLQGKLNNPTMVLDLIEDAINQNGVIAVPYIAQMDYIYGQDLDSYSTDSAHNVFLYNRNGEMSARRNGEINNQVNRQNGFINFASVKNISMPQSSLEKFQGKSGQTIKRIHKAQNVYLGLLQVLCSRFSADESGREAFGTMGMYFKVKTIGGDLAVLSPDPLSFAKLYDEFATHNATLSPQKVKKSQGVVLMDPDILKSRSIKGSTISENLRLNCTKLTSNPIIRNLCFNDAEIDIEGEITYKTTEPLKNEIIRMSFPMLNHWSNQPRNDEQQELKDAWIAKYDKICIEVNRDLSRLGMLISIFRVFKGRYPNAILPVADFRTMTETDLKVILSRYKNFGPYQVLEGVDYPTNFTKIVQQQLDSMKTGYPQQTPQSYTDFAAKYKKVYESSFVARQSEKIGALVGVLPVGGGYRIYMPITDENLNNLGRLTNTSAENYNVVRDVSSSTDTTHGPARLCIGHFKSYKMNIHQNDLHFALVSPEGKLVWINSIKMSTKNGNRYPTRFSDWGLVRNDDQSAPLSASYKPKSNDWTGYKERELLSLLSREYLKWIRTWLEDPKTESGTWPSQVSWKAVQQSTGWSGKGLHESLLSKSREGGTSGALDFDTMIDLGSELNQTGYISPIFSEYSLKIGSTLGDPKLIEARFPDGNKELYSDMRKKALLELELAGFRWPR